MGVALFIVYAMGILASGAIICRKANSREGFSINNRNSSAWLVGFSIVVSCVGASATMGTVGLAFSVGTPAFWWLGSGALGLSVLTIFLARKIRRSHAITLPEMVQDFFGSQARWIISLIIVVAWLAILAAQFTALKQIIAVLTGSSQASACLLGAGLIAAHTLLGGQAGIIKLDKWQGVILLFGLLLVISWLLGINGDALSEVRFEIVNREFSADRLIYFLLILGGSYVVCPMLFGRLLSARNEQAAQKGALGAVLALFLVSAMVVMIGLLSKGLIPAHTVPDQVLSTVLEQVFPWWLSALVYLMLLSVLVSSADSCLITAGVILSHDLLKRDSIISSRICVLGLCAAGLLLTMLGKDILGFLLMANDVYVCGVVGPVFVGIMLHRRKTCRRSIIIAAILLGGSLGLVASLTENAIFSYLGLGLSVGLSLLSVEPIAVAKPKTPAC